MPCQQYTSNPKIKIHAWTKGQVEVYNRVVTDYTTKIYHDDSAEPHKSHLMAFVFVYNFQRPLYAPKYLSRLMTKSSKSMK